MYVHLFRVKSYYKLIKWFENYYMLRNVHAQKLHTKFLYEFNSHELLFIKKTKDFIFKFT